MISSFLTIKETSPKQHSSLQMRRSVHEPPAKDPPEERSLCMNIQKGLEKKWQQLYTDFRCLDANSGTTVLTKSPSQHPLTSGHPTPCLPDESHPLIVSSNDQVELNLTLHVLI